MPSDLGAFLIVRQLQCAVGPLCVEVRANFQMHSGFDGSTQAWNSRRYESGQIEMGRGPLLLNPPPVRFVCESALAWVLNASQLPGGFGGGGLLTPGSGHDDVFA